MPDLIQRAINHAAESPAGSLIFTRILVEDKVVLSKRL
jgi:hypothetical protein